MIITTDTVVHRKTMTINQAWAIQDFFHMMKKLKLCRGIGTSVTGLPNPIVTFTTYR